MITLRLPVEGKRRVVLSTDVEKGGKRGIKRKVYQGFSKFEVTVGHPRRYGREAA